MTRFISFFFPRGFNQPVAHFFLLLIFSFIPVASYLLLSFSRVNSLRGTRSRGASKNTQSFIVSFAQLRWSFILVFFKHEPLSLSRRWNFSRDIRMTTRSLVKLWILIFLRFLVSKEENTLAFLFVEILTCSLRWRIIHFSRRSFFFLKRKAVSQERFQWKFFSLALRPFVNGNSFPPLASSQRLLLASPTSLSLSPLLRKLLSLSFFVLLVLYFPIEIKKVAFLLFWRNVLLCRAKHLFSFYFPCLSKVNFLFEINWLLSFELFPVTPKGNQMIIFSVDILNN